MDERLSGEATGRCRTAAAVGLLSAASLGFELLLLRWFALLYWHHVAHLIISVALLGLGVAGSVLSLSQAAVLRRFETAFTIAACGFAVSLPLVLIAIGRTGFNPLAVVWDPGQTGRLAGMFLISTVPFAFSGFAIGLAMRRFPDRIAILYRADLSGAAAGAVLLPLGLMTAPPPTLVPWLVVPALAAALLVPRAGHRRQSCLAFSVVLAAGVFALWPRANLAPVMSPYKGLPQALRIPGVRTVAEQVSPAGIAVALDSQTVPFRYAPGLSMRSPAEPPRQSALFLDGHAAGAIDHAGDDPAASAYLEWMSAALPYVLAPEQPSVLVLGAGGGTDVRHARRAGAATIDAVEPSGALLTVVGRVTGTDPIRPARSDAETGRARTRWRESEPRAFLASTPERYDVIQISLLGTAAPHADAAQAMRVDYLHTIEGVRLMLRRLTDRGVVAITLPVDLPPRAPVKLMATLAAAAQAEGLGSPANRVAAVRSWNTVTLVMARRALTPDRIAAVRAFARQRAFDLVWVPDLDAAEANRVNVLDHPYFFEAARALLADGDAASFFDRYPFHVRPATDDKPYFGRYFRWRSFPGWWAQRAAGTAAFLEWSYLLAWMLVAVVVVLAIPLVAWPLRPLSRAAAANGEGARRHAARAIYVTALGLAFLFLEIVFIHKFVLFLGHPVVSMAVVVPSFLAFAGWGSGCSEALDRRIRRRQATATGGWRPGPVMTAALAISVVAIGYAVGLPSLFHHAAGWPTAARVTLSVLLIGGLAFWMGFPFPLGLKRLAASQPAWIPLAWGINGLASVISAVGVGLLALHGGFRLVTAVALALYLLAGRLERHL